jgi:hypothetical protein
MTTRTNYYALCYALFFILLSNLALAQTQSEKLTVSIKVSSFTNSSVSFSWDNFDINYTDIYRKKISDNSWSLLQSSVSGTAYTDNTVSSDVEYEYKFVVTTNTTSIPTAYGYIAFGTQISKKTSRGNILLVVDDRFTSTLANELDNLQYDLISDGYTPILTTCNKDSSVTCVKSMVDSINNASSLNSIYLIGHIPVPYAGIIFPDGHTDHRGAWPTDLFYVTDSTNWTDNSINYNNTTRTANSNIINDGKYDQSTISDESFASVSRIDFYDLPSNGNSESDLLKNYLNSASKYKRGELEADDNALIDDKLSSFSEGFARNGYMNFSSLFGDSITTGDLITNLENRTHKWAYSCSYGTDTSLWNTATPSSLKNSNYQGIFSMVFGSYFGDWNTEDNFMRSLLADGKMLTTCWAGRPHWFYHHMGLNNPISLSTKMSVENSTASAYLTTTAYDVAGYSPNSVHMSLLGDLTLRQNYNKAIDNFSGAYDSTTSKIDLSWNTPANVSVTGYEIYKASSKLGTYTLLASVSNGTNTYTDNSVLTDNFYYIKYISLDTTLSGSYYNNSVGTFIQLTPGSSSNAAPLPVELMSFKAEKIKEDGVLTWASASEVNFSHYEVEKSLDMNTWNLINTVSGSEHNNQVNNYFTIDSDLGKGITYYRLKMVDYDGSVEYSHIETLSTTRNKLSVYPNPTTTNSVTVSTERRLKNIKSSDIEVLDNNGRSVSFVLNDFTGQLSIDGSKGIYTVRVLGESRRIILL